MSMIGGWWVGVYEPLAAEVQNPMRYNLAPRLTLYVDTRGRSIVCADRVNTKYLREVVRVDGEGSSILAGGSSLY
jgi:hypothetical protein